jgi:hypothetical protein
LKRRPMLKQMLKLLLKRPIRKINVGRSPNKAKKASQKKHVIQTRWCFTFL